MTNVLGHIYRPKSESDIVQIDEQILADTEIDYTER